MRLNEDKDKKEWSGQKPKERSDYSMYEYSVLTARALGFSSREPRPNLIGHAHPE